MSAAASLSKFLDEMTAIQATLTDSTSAFDKNALEIDSYQSVVELLHIQALAKFEAYLANLFYTCALGTSGLADVSPVVHLGSAAEVDLLVYAEGTHKEKYLAWLPYYETLGRAESYLVDGNPFTRLKYRPIELETLSDSMTIRNAIAHSSAHSIAQFTNLAIIRSYPHSRPADYLLSTRGANTEVLLSFASLRLIAEALASLDHAAADAMLNPERPFSGDAGGTPAGDFECASCGYAKSAHPGGKIGVCPNCGRGAPCPHCGRAQGPVQWRRLI